MVEKETTHEGDSVRKKERFDGYVEGIILYEGTEVLPPKKIAELTGGHSIELHLKGEDMKINLSLAFGEQKVSGNCVIEVISG